MAKSIKFNFELPDMEYDALMLMLKKANLTTDDIFVSKIKGWVHANMDLLNEKELKQFAPILKHKNLKTVKTKNAST